MLPLGAKCFCVSCPYTQFLIWPSDHHEWSHRTRRVSKGKGGSRLMHVYIYVHVYRSLSSHLMWPVQAFRECTENGTWWLSPSGKEWANYTLCVNTDTLMVSGRGHLFVFFYKKLSLLSTPATATAFRLRH